MSTAPVYTAVRYTEPQARRRPKSKAKLWVGMVIAVVCAVAGFVLIDFDKQTDQRRAREAQQEASASLLQNIDDTPDFDWNAPMDSPAPSSGNKAGGYKRN